VFEVSLIVGAWVAVSIAVGASLAVEVIGGEAYAPAAPVLAFQGVALGAMFVSVVWANALLSLGLYRPILVISVGALVLNSILVALLVTGGGARGAAIATAISEVLAAVVQALAVMHRRHQLRPPLRVVPRVALAAALGLTPLAMTTIPVIARIAISTTLFVAVLWITRAFPPELRALIPASLSRTHSVGS
jgi:O-antigen/teichoic acid export membrane protein